MGKLSHLIFIVPKGSIAKKTKVIMKPTTTQGDTMSENLTPEQIATSARYCESCGAQINGEGAWGHDTDCPLNK